jgi:hypothetical protein
MVHILISFIFCFIVYASADPNLLGSDKNKNGVRDDLEEWI